MKKILLLTIFCLLATRTQPAESLSIKERLRKAREKENTQSSQTGTVNEPAQDQNDAAQEPSAPETEKPKSTISKPEGKRCSSSQCGGETQTKYPPPDQPYQQQDTPIGIVGEDGNLRGEMIKNSIYNPPTKKALSQVLNNTSLPAAAYNDGEFISYFNNGRIIYRRYTMKDRVLVGEFQEYHINGALKRELFFKNGYILKEFSYQPASWPGSF
ncbi:MAG: hypothetical protein K8S27_09905 [Candidatus Omnitrophica bacterium]|nr:hypothetical protein [Candidatus Omnitrophota bacterium]